MRALGYSAVAVGLHYAAMAAVIALAGAAAGAAGGVALGRAFARSYAGFYRLPVLAFEGEAGTVALAAALALAGGLAGALGAVRIAARLPPAEAMRPAAPPTFRPTALERLGLLGLFPPGGRMVLRDAGRRPVRVALSAAGLAAAVGMIRRRSRWTWSCSRRRRSASAPARRWR